LYLNYKLEHQNLTMNERTHTWDPPLDIAEKLLNLDKEDRRKLFTELKPDSFGIGSLMGFSKIEIDEKGQASFYCVPKEFHYNPIGSVHGGLAATLLDSCNSISAQCNLDKGFIALTTDIKVNYLSQISAETGEIVARGKIDKLGRKVIFLTGELRAMNGKLLATASSTELVVAIS